MLHRDSTVSLNEKHLSHLEGVHMFMHALQGGQVSVYNRKGINPPQLIE